MGCCNVLSTPGCANRTTKAKPLARALKDKGPTNQGSRFELAPERLLGVEDLRRVLELGFRNPGCRASGVEGWMLLHPACY